MSEEILKALMQLFAIIARQDNVLIENHEKFVSDFLTSQLSLERVEEYLALYREFLAESKPESTEGDVKEKSRTSMKDSVRTLAICKKINKTLAQKQKVIVLIRLLEFFRNDAHASVNRMAIVETVADVFKIEKSEFAEIKSFVFEEKNNFTPNEIIISELPPTICKEHITVPHFTGNCKFIHLPSINLVIVKYSGEAEVFLNGVVIKPESIYLFPHGSTLRLPQTSIYYSSIISRFLSEHVEEKFTFNASITEHRFKNGTQALHEINISEGSGHLVGIMGASGSGKTTLLTLLSGQDKPSNGSVTINGIDIYQKKNGLEGIMGFVPQDDLLIEDLTVYQNLYYNARLCFSDSEEGEINRKIARILISLGLDEIKHIKVGSPLNKKISGGQRKRLNIALELIREPHILFLDEPTSGLSSRDSENVIDLLKELSFKGKLIFVVIHQPSSDIFKMFDRMFILDTGGYPAYYGNPVEAVTYFKKITSQINSDVAECHACGSVNPETIFNLIDLKEIDEYGNYTEKRRIQPSRFYEFYKEKIKINRAPESGDQIKSSLKVPGKIAQIWVFFLRDLFSKLSNKQYILINLLEVPVLAIFLSLIIRYTDKAKGDTYSYYYNYNIPAYFFMSIIVALLVGLTISAEEIYKDQKILKRERFLHLSRFSYLISKVILLFSISLLQTVLFTAIGNLVLGVNYNYFSFFAMLFSIFAFSNILGLLLSSTFNSPVTIYIIIPLVIIPQLLLGGAMFNYNKLSALFGGGNKVPAAANFMVSRWAYEGIMVDMFINGKYEKEKYKLDKAESRLNYKLTYFIPKLEELIEHSENLPLVTEEIKKDKYVSAETGFEEPLPDFKNSSEVKLYLKKLRAFYNQKYIGLIALKEKKLEEIATAMGGDSVYTDFKRKYHNNRLEEIVTAALEKEKIVAEEGKLVQIIDPVYRDKREFNPVASFDAAFFAPEKNLFGRTLSTYSFNLLVIWIINIFVFVLLHFDVFKKLMSRFI